MISSNTKYSMIMKSIVLIKFVIRFYLGLSQMVCTNSNLVSFFLNWSFVLDKFDSVKLSKGYYK